MKRKNQARCRVCKAPRVVPTDLTPTASILDLDDMIVTIMRWGPAAPRRVRHGVPDEGCPNHAE